MRSEKRRRPKPGELKRRRKKGSWRDWRLSHILRAKQRRRKRQVMEERNRTSLGIHQERVDGRDDMFLGSPRRRCRPRLWPRMILLNTYSKPASGSRIDGGLGMVVNQKREGCRCTSSPRGGFLPLGLPHGYRISSEDPGDGSRLCAAFHPRSIFKIA